MRPRSEQHDHAGNNGRSGINKEEEAEGNVGEDAAEGGPEAHSQIDGQPVQGERGFALRSRGCIGNDRKTRRAHGFVQHAPEKGNDENRGEIARQWVN